MSELNNCCGTTCNKQLVQSEFAALKHQLEMKELEVQHCHTVCDELRGKMDALSAQVEALKRPLQVMVDLMSSGDEAGESSEWYKSAVLALDATPQKHQGGAE